MSLKVRASGTTVIAGQERLRELLRFPDGLNLICAENNMGKTTALTTILYALGWEGMLGPGRKPPFTPALTSEIDAGLRRLPVTESSVLAEFDDGRGDPLTVRRSVRSDSERPELVRTWHSADIAKVEAGVPSQDFYVRTQGAAQREAGFHHLLERYIGWNLPEVRTWDGEAVKLYMEIIAPFLFVEQTRGWAWIGSVMPRYLRVRDPERRATEFLLSIDSLTNAVERDSLTARREELRGSWRAKVEAFVDRAGERGVRVESLPTAPVADWPQDAPPTLLLLDEDRWSSFSEVLSKMRRDLAEASREVPTVEEAVEGLTADLRAAEGRAAELAGFLGAASRDMREQQAELQSLEDRLEALRQDKARYDDAIRLRQFGSTQDLMVDQSHCPTCEQPLPSTLLGTDIGPVMTLEENQTLIAEEIKTFSAMSEDARNVLVATRQRVGAIQQNLSETRRDIRSLKATLTQSSGAPSLSVIARQVRLADRIEELEEIESELENLNAELSDDAREYRDIAENLARLGKQGALTDGDKAKLDLFAELIRDQLDEYGFTSLPAREIDIAPDTYLPTRADSPVRPDQLSASDRVRMVWAYLTALLEVARSHETAHPGLLILDEPGQQEISDESLSALFRRLSVAGEFNQQVIVATSKPAAIVRGLLGSSTATLHEIDGYLLKGTNNNT